MIVIGLFSCLLASALLFDPRSVFYVDWNNHLWIIEYFGESIKHGVIPGMLNTQQLVGMPFPLFYAQKFYVLLGTLSSLLGSSMTIRAMVFIVFFLQFVHIYRAAEKIGAPQKIAMGMAVIVTWAIYPLTNLYNRSALTEFFAVAFLTCSVVSFLSVLINLKDRTSKYDMIAAGLFFVIAALIHPLTALFGGLFLGILGLIALFFCEKERKLQLLRYFSITALFSLLILSPWIYLLGQFNDKLPVSSHETNAAYFHKTYFFPESIDNVLSRLSPFPLDLKSVQNGVLDKDVFTPYIDVQITLPLIILIAVFIYIGFREKSIGICLNVFERAILWGSAGILMMSFTESVCPKTFDWLGGFFNILQFPYRLVTYVNLSALVMLIVLAGRVSVASIKAKQIINICLAVCIAISFCAVIQKLVHASAIVQKSTKINKGIWVPLPLRSISHLNELPATFYGAGDYTVKEGFAKGSVSGSLPYIIRNFNVSAGDRFGQVEALTVDLAEPTLVITNVQAFPWNHIIINGTAQNPYSIIVIGMRGAVVLPQGKYHLEYVTRIDEIWKSLNLLSWALLWAWIVLCMVFALKKEHS